MGLPSNKDEIYDVSRDEQFITTVIFSEAELRVNIITGSGTDAGSGNVSAPEAKEG